MQLSSKRWFTLLEILIATVIISIAFIAILQLITQAARYAYRTQEQIIAAQLAQEGIEGVYSIRNTNLLRWAGLRDFCWLKTVPMVDDANDGCINDAWIQSGWYLLSSETNLQGNTYWILTGFTTTPPSAETLSNVWTGFGLCMMYGKWQPCPDNWTGTIQYYRTIQSLGVFLKNVQTVAGQWIDCASGIDEDSDIMCGDTAAKEVRICSSVRYLDNDWNEMRICSILTNFRDDGIEYNAATLPLNI